MARFACHGRPPAERRGRISWRRGVEIEGRSTDAFPIQRDLQAFADAGGQVLACGTCLKSRGSHGTPLCPLSTLADLYGLVRDSDRIISF